MKILVKLFSLVVCMISLFASCEKPKEKEPEIHEHEGLIPCPYTDIVKSVTNSCFQVGDSTYTFNLIEGCYYYSPFHKQYLFYVHLMDSLKSIYPLIEFEIFTGEREPNRFFQKGNCKIDTLNLHNETLISGISICRYFYEIRAVFTWDSVYYENRAFMGMGSFEIMDTLFTDYYPDIYYPPQKIKFEFK